MKKLLFLTLLFISANVFADETSIWYFNGKAALNAGTSPKKYSTSYQVEQETKTWDFGYLNEGSLSDYKRDGLFALRRISFSLTPKLETSVAFGPYLSATTVENTVDTTQYHYRYGASVLTAISIKYHLPGDFGVQARYQHAVISSDGRDTDQLFAALGYYFR